MDRPPSRIRPASSTAQLTLEQRQQVKQRWKKKQRVWQIANAMKVEPWLIYREVVKLEDNT